MRQEKMAALVRHMRDYPKAQVYEGCDATGKRGSGRYFLSQGVAVGPEFSKAEVDELVRSGILKFDYPEFYSRGPSFPSGGKHEA